jgi:hypothetical protein
MSEQIQAEQTTKTSQEAGKREADTSNAGPEASGSGADNILQSHENGVDIPDQEHGRVTATAQFAFQGQAVRTILKDGETWFVAADVCAVLEHTNSRVAVSRLEDDEKGVSSVYTLGGGQETTVVNESGLYNLIFTSRKPQAKAFRRWVTSEVLPSIRATGRYDVGGDPQTGVSDDAGRGHIKLPAFGRFVVTMRPDGPHIHETDFMALLDEIRTSDVEVLSHSLGLIYAYWQKVQELRSVGYDPADGFAVSQLELAIQEGGRIGKHYLRCYAEAKERRPE